MAQAWTYMKIYYPHVRTHIKLLWDSSVPQLGNTFAFLHYELSNTHEEI